MPRKQNEGQIQRARLRALRRSEARIEHELQSGRLIGPELIGGERELRRTRAAILREERRGLIGRPPTVTVEPTIAPVARPALSPADKEALHALLGTHKVSDPAPSEKPPKRPMSDEEFAKAIGLPWPPKPKDQGDPRA